MCSPATEALELLNDDPNVMFDLNEMLKRDPTLSALVKEEPGTTTSNSGGQIAPHPQQLQPQFGVQASAVLQTKFLVRQPDIRYITSFS